MILIVAGIVAGVFLLVWWRNSSNNLHIERRNALPGEFVDPTAVLSQVDAPVKIGEKFQKFDGVPSKLDGAWPCFRGANHDNIVSTPLLLSEHWDEKGLPVRWSVNLGEGYAGPVILNGCVYLLDYDDKEDADSLRCFSLDNGKEIWRRWYHVHVKRNHGMSRTVPAVTDRHVITIGPRCHVMCTDARNGEFKWGIDLEKEWGASVPMWYTGQCPLVDGNQVIIGVGGKALLIGVDCETGKVLWQTPNEKKWKMSHSSVLPMSIAGRKMYVYCSIGGITGVSAEKDDIGKIVWETGEWNHQVVAPAPVSLGDGRIFMTSGYGVGSAMFKVVNSAGNFFVTKLYDLDKKIFACEQHTPIFYKGYLFSVLPADAGPVRKQAVCLNPDGKVAWTSGSSERFGLGPFMVINDKLIILEDNGMLTMAKATEQGYVKLAQSKVLDGKESWAPMAFANGFLLLRDYETMRCLDLRKVDEK
ncbi:MAG: hypothetical protein A2283_15420 [Lentisphaerae bacterium RIFOXYA12_FULL_48_11]|nr:MAG: hypothetical protein A2283_15420 [Lentisphaerae bacterium RIFOXYA12_FULL_48_11]